uniref:Invasion protein IalB, involved in pathogenesis n=1 Tax=Candidatus Kentrum sp. DK TaxID=2126562 RepID=A0A450T1P0_9GAMM|nr:MAG: Invasion protein IalB, involved in pathogenesis [Candidatus Kentron sp. DK]
MKQTMHNIRIVVAILLALFVSIGAGNVFGEEKKEVSTTPHGDWVLQCPKEKGPKAEKPCALIQQIIADKSKSPIVSIIFLQAGDPASLHTIVRMPLGVALPPGMSLQIDDGEASKWRFNHCEPGGCLVTSKVSPEVRKKLEAGAKANIGFYSIGGQKIVVPASLKGITAGLNALEKQ